MIQGPSCICVALTIIALHGAGAHGPQEILEMTYKGSNLTKARTAENDLIGKHAPRKPLAANSTAFSAHKKYASQLALQNRKVLARVQSTDESLDYNRTTRMISNSHGTLNFEESDESRGRSLQPTQVASVKRVEDPGTKDKKNVKYQCYGMTRFMYEARRSFPSETIPPFDATRVNESVVIENRSSCNMSFFNISQVTVLNVTVATCCITHCEHVIVVSVSKDEHILLNFKTFNVPGLNLLRSEAFNNCDESLDVLVEDPHQNRSHLLGHFCGIKAPTAVFVEYNQVKLRLRLHDNKQCVDKMNFKVEIVPCLKPVFQTCNSSEYVSFNGDHGFISSPGMNKGLNYPNELECEWSITVPEGKLILLKAERILLKEGDKIEINPDYNNTKMFPKKLNFSDFEFRRPVVLPSHKCTVKFHSDSLKSGIGFNISYSAVEKSHFIPMFKNNSLDCSNVANLPEVIRCDYYEDCVGGEDEMDCPYVQRDCPGGYVYNGHCYMLVANQVNVSWTKAEEFCERNLGAHLVTINTVEENNFLNYFRKFKELENTTFLGLRRMRMQQVKQVYKRMWQWTDGSTAFYLPNEYRYEGWARCSLLNSDYFHSTECGALKENISFICEKTLTEDESSGIPYGDLEFRHSSWKDKIDVFKCHSGEYISSEQRCDTVERCFDHSDESGCKPDDDNDEPMFACSPSARLPYSFVCDGIEDCPDASDETGCKIPDKSALGLTVAICTDKMYLNRSRVCDGREDCRDASDEEDCTECVSGFTLCPMIACLPQKWINDSEIDCPIRDLKGRQALESEFKENAFVTISPPGIIEPDGYGKFEIKEIMSGDGRCPDTHAQCYKGYCIPVYMWCNQIRDCPYGEDEDTLRCEKLCKGLYKCKHSTVCVHNDHLCDGVYHCPLHDDETLCTFKNIVCPQNCKCSRYEFNCTSPPEIDRDSPPVPVRSLQLKNYTKLHQLHLTGIAFYSLIFLNVSFCGVQFITDDYLRFSNLRILDASNNLIENLSNDSFKNSPALKILILSHNKLHNKNYTFLQHTKELSTLDLSFNIKNKLENNSFLGASDLEVLILQEMNIEIINEGAFDNLVALKRVDLKGNSILIFSEKIFVSLKNLKYIITDNYRLCCDSVKPNSVQSTDCDAPFDEISSCSDILRTLLLRAALWIMAILTLTGNLGVIFYRIFIDRGLKESFRIIITCLSTSDLLMGVYLVIIGVADSEYRDRYQLNETEWKNSVPCQAAGFLCLLSSETSALFILLVTLDRLLAIAFPLNPHLHFNAKSAALGCGIVWLIGICMASIPLLPPFQHWQLYTQKAVGVPLPITRSLFPGYDYAFAILIVFNMIVFILVAVGQLLIYLSVRLQNIPQVSEIRVRQDTAIAKRLALVIITDCLCWFPITVMGLAARSGYPVPGEMYVVATVFLLPANSAFNPFLYTANAILLARRMRKKKQCIEIDIGMRQLSTT